MRITDPGHVYELDVLDAEGNDWHLSLIFVKRNHPPEKFPGNKSAHSGTTSQEVILGHLSTALNMCRGSSGASRTWSHRRFSN